MKNTKIERENKTSTILCDSISDVVVLSQTEIGTKKYILQLSHQANDIPIEVKTNDTFSFFASVDRFVFFFRTNVQKKTTHLQF